MIFFVSGYGSILYVLGSANFAPAMVSVPIRQRFIDCIHDLGHCLLTILRSHDSLTSVCIERFDLREECWIVLQLVLEHRFRNLVHRAIENILQRSPLVPIGTWTREMVDGMLNNQRLSLFANCCHDGCLKSLIDLFI